jgi:phage-related protein
MLHVPGRADRSTPFKGYYESGDELLFAVFVHVNGKDVTGEAVSLSGEVWDSFPLAGEGFGLIGAVKAPPVTE